jgi:hypothetical protein
MTTKTKNSRKSAAKLQQNCRKTAAELPQVRYAFAPLLQQFRAHTRKNEARLWLPVETNLISRYEFAALSPQNRYIFVAILLYMAGNGIDEIPLDARFMSSVLIVDERMLRKCFDELLFHNLLQEKKERIEKKSTDRQETARAGVSVEDENLFKTESENQENENRKQVGKNGSSPNGHLSSFSLDECKRYVEKEIQDGAQIQNVGALAMKLFKTGEADSFIKARLYPEQFAAEMFGEPIKFTDQPCSVCFGAKMANVEDKGYRKCVHCRNERGQSTGLEPEGENNDEGM